MSILFSLLNEASIYNFALVIAIVGHFVLRTHIRARARALAHSNNAISQFSDFQEFTSYNSALSNTSAVSFVIRIGMFISFQSTQQSVKKEREMASNNIVSFQEIFRPTIKTKQNGRASKYRTLRKHWLICLRASEYSRILCVLVCFITSTFLFFVRLFAIGYARCACSIRLSLRRKV